MNLNTDSNKKAENVTLRFFVYPFLENTHNTACNCPWLHPTIGNTSGRRTIGKKQHNELMLFRHRVPVSGYIIGLTHSYGNTKYFLRHD